nr:unnamed protein product [Spirometra erinaceieuropaei]
MIFAKLDLIGWLSTAGQKRRSEDGIDDKACAICDERAIKAIFGFLPIAPAKLPFEDNEGHQGNWQIEETTEGLDYEFLRSRLPILLYADTNLYEDELGDNGTSVLNVKIRVMSNGFFVLQRFFLRVDGALLRVWDTRLQWRKGDRYVLRDIKRVDSAQWLPGMAGVGINEAEAHCSKLLEHRTEKLIPLDFPLP